MVIPLIFVFAVANLSLASSQAIPYSYASGRDVNAVESRYARFLAAKARNAGPDELYGICGRVDANAKCTTQVGRPKDHESLACDSLCCLAGSKVGNCGSSYGFKLDFGKIIGALALPGSGAIAGGLKPEIAAQCYCSDNSIEVRCGRDGSFAGIRCPDNSACWRKCCREGRSGGSCGGFLHTKCKCH